MDRTTDPARSLSPDPPRRTTSDARETFESIRGQASKATGGADSFRCCCPAHDDRSPSLSVRYETDRVLLHCWTGCEPAAVVEAFGLTLADLFDVNTDIAAQAFHRSAHGDSRSAPGAQCRPRHRGA